MANAGSIDAECAHALFRAAVELKPEARAKFVQDGSPNETVRLEVERLLREHELAGNTISTCGQPNWGIQPKHTRLSEGEVLAARFRIIRFIAAGGMGEVYEADDIELRERVAIKTIHPDILQRQDAVLRFKREVHLARQVTHPNVCRIHDLFRHISTQGDSQEEIIFVSMEFLCGKTLSSRLKESGRMSMQEALPLVEQMAAALSAAHDEGIVHHDFKPGNVVLVGCDSAQKPMRVVVTDFGLASRSISSGVDRSYATLGNREVFGTPAYMAPEQIQGRPGTIASDIYALGLVMYEMVTGEHPFDGNTPISIAMNRLSEAPIPPRRFAPELSATWEAVVLRCLERDPAKRFSRALEISAALANGSQIRELGVVQNAAGSLAVDEHSTVERQSRVLEAAAPKESAVGRSTEVVTMVRRVESGGLREYLNNEVVPSVTSEDVRERPFELDFVLDEQGKALPAEICLRLDSPDFQPPTQTKKLRVPPRGDSVACTFLIRPTIPGELVANLELLKGEEVVVSRSIRTRALAEGVPVREGINIVSIPLTITVQDSVARVAIVEAGGAPRAISLERIPRDSTGTHVLALGEGTHLEEEEKLPQAAAPKQKVRDKAERKRQLKEQKLAERARGHTEALARTPDGKTIVASHPHVLKNAKVLTASGAVLMALVVATVSFKRSAPGPVPVEITSAPPGTTVRVKSTGQECVVPFCTIKLRPGQHELELSHPGYETMSQNISVRGKGPNTFPMELRELPAVAVAAPPPPRPVMPPLPPPHPQKAENPDLWPQFAKSGSADQLEQYRAQHPNSPHLGELEAQLDDLYWGKAVGVGTVAGFDEYLAKSPNGKHRDEAHENLAWLKAEDSNTIAALQDYQGQFPQGPHSAAANKRIEDLTRAEDQNKDNQRFQEARNSSDEATLQAFLNDYPSGSHHDEIYGRLDDLVWGKTKEDDVISLQAYVGKMSAGKHVSQANEAIEKMTLAEAKYAKPPKPAVDAKAEILKVVERYVKAYNDTSIEELRQIWPGMDKKRVSSMHSFFREAQNVRSSYTLVEEPKVNGADATVRIAQVTTFVFKGQQQTQSGTLTLKLKLVPGTSGSWEISSVSE